MIWHSCRDLERPEETTSIPNLGYLPDEAVARRAGHRDPLGALGATGEWK